jgi:hypothetical protein
MTLETKMSELAGAIDAVLIAGHGQEHWLKSDHPPFFSHAPGDSDRGDEEATLAAALEHYGGQPSAGFDLWCMCRAVALLRRVWTGKEISDEPIHEPRRSDVPLVPGSDVPGGVPVHPEAGAVHP